MTERPIVLIAGLGEGLGVSLAGLFAKAGYDVIGLSRSGHAASAAETEVKASGGAFTHLACDLAKYDEVVERVKPVAGRVEVLIHTTHSLLIKPFPETSPEQFEAVWRAGCLSAMHVASVIAPEMVALGRGTIIITGATASTRGAAKFAAFASAKFALRGLAQSLARELGPKGVHVAHVLVDGLIDEPQSTRRFGSANSQRIDPNAIASTYLTIVRQQQSAWTHELDLRPSSESF